MKKNIIKESVNNILKAARCAGIQNINEDVMSTLIAKSFINEMEAAEMPQTEGEVEGDDAYYGQIPEYSQEEMDAMAVNALAANWDQCKDNIEWEVVEPNVWADAGEIQDATEGVLRFTDANKIEWEFVFKGYHTRDAWGGSYGHEVSFSDDVEYQGCPYNVDGYMGDISGTISGKMLTDALNGVNANPNI